MSPLFFNKNLNAKFLQKKHIQLRIYTCFAKKKRYSKRTQV